MKQKFMLFCFMILFLISCSVRNMDKLLEEGVDAELFPDKTFTEVENVTLHYFGIGDTLTLNHNKAVNGSLLIVGGALSSDNAAIYQEFINLAGGVDQARIAIIPTASGSPIVNSEAYRNDFINYGVSSERIYIVPVAVKDDPATGDVDESTWLNNGFDPTTAADLEAFQATAVWFIGGWQDRIVNALVDSDGHDGAVLRIIRQIKEDGGVIGGTSAGAAIMSGMMINGGTSLGALTEEMIYEDRGESDPRLFIAEGLGFFPFGIVDQHFIARGRFGRLISACYHQQVPLGFGIDENTAISVTDKTIKVLGEEQSRSGLVMIDLPGTGLANYTQNSQRYLDTVGYEYFATNQLHSDIFAANALVDVICEGLVDCEATTAEGVSFEMYSEQVAVGIKTLFKQDAETFGWYGKIGSTYTYTVVNVRVDVTPITLGIADINLMRSQNQNRLNYVR
ncbi:MAG: cyanophycinase [Spirochaetes bacterium]|nr:cyanophycinase [Spirochaetota bacterium]